MGYDYEFFKADTIQPIAKDMLAKIKSLNEIKRKPTIDNLLSRGASGCAIASAILAISDIPLTHTFVRKPHESTHGRSLCAGVHGNGASVIVDDIVSTGDTVREILKYSDKSSIKVRAILVAWDYANSEVNNIKVYRCGGHNY